MSFQLLQFHLRRCNDELHLFANRGFCCGGDAQKHVLSLARLIRLLKATTVVPIVLLLASEKIRGIRWRKITKASRARI
eukprot:Skav234209  [mRNA]  locus=scaffold2795:119783:122227:+ [translate_table: standard]